MGADLPAAATALPKYLQTLDATPDAVLSLLSPDFRFSIVWADEDGAKEFAGGLDALVAYLAQRDGEGHRHHVLGSMRIDNTEFLYGRTSRHQQALAIFVNVAEVDEEGRLTTLFGARTTSVGGPGLT